MFDFVLVGREKKTKTGEGSEEVRDNFNFVRQFQFGNFLAHDRVKCARLGRFLFVPSQKKRRFVCTLVLVPGHQSEVAWLNFENGINAWPRACVGGSKGRDDCVPRVRMCVSISVVTRANSGCGIKNTGNAFAVRANDDE